MGESGILSYALEMSSEKINEYQYNLAGFKVSHMVSKPPGEYQTLERSGVYDDHTETLVLME